MATRTDQRSGDTSNRGFASMDDEKQREIARKGGQSVAPEDRSFSKDHESRGRGRPQGRSEASTRPIVASRKTMISPPRPGRKGGQHSQGGPSGSEDRSQPGRGGNFADDPERAAEAGRKGGQHNHGSR